MRSVDDKNFSLRRALLQQRQQLSSHEQITASQHIFQKIISTNWFQRSKRIAFYAAHHNEISCQALIAYAWQMKKQCFLPKLAIAKRKQLFFLLYTPKTLLHPNHYGILEPQSTSRFIQPWTLDCIIVPVVAFDAQCNRLGWGAGYYDRTLEFIQQYPNRPHPLLVGVAYEFQKVSALSAQAWDVPLDYVITEEQIYKR